MALTFDKSTRLRLRRLFRRRQKQVEAATQLAGEQVETNFIGRFEQLWSVRRFAAGWMALLVLVSVCTVVQTLALSSYYQSVQPVAGGVYNEGMVGVYSNANPIYASSAVDAAVSRLVFAGLFTYDNQNRLTGELASGYTVDNTGRHYTVTLRPGLTWQDGAPLTAADVAFTYQTIQNPDAHSPLLSSWQGVTVTAVTSTSIRFDLPNPLAAFPFSLTNGIIPRHILGTVPVDKLRANDFNTIKPVGAGPFAWRTLEVGSVGSKTSTIIALEPFNHYTGGQPKLAGFVIRAYGDTPSAIAAYKHREVQALAGFTNLPTELATRSDVHTYTFGSTVAQMAFFKTSSGVLADTDVRRALVQATDTAAILKGLSYQTKPVWEPFLIGQLGYDPAYRQASYNVHAAKTALQTAGWLPAAHGIRAKNGQQLAFALYAEDTPENTRVAKQLAADWRAVGADVTLTLQQTSDFQTTLSLHTYDAVLYGISIGTDPDVFAYWDSRQADVRATNRLNFSEYRSAPADAALEAGRTRLDTDLRTVKYRPFLQAWQSDAPAVGLYQPRFLYITRTPVYGLDEHTLNVETDRYSSVAHWQILTAKVTD